MMRRTSALIVAAVVLLAAAAVPTPLVAGSPRVPLAFQTADAGTLPGGMAMEVLASMEVDALVAQPANMPVPLNPTLRLDRVPVKPRSTVALGQSAFNVYENSSLQGPQLLFVETGDVVVVAGDEEETYRAGESAVVPLEEWTVDGEQFQETPAYELRNDGEDCASVLRLSFGTVSLQGAFESSGDVPNLPEPSCADPEVLLFGDGTEWPTVPSVLVVTRVTWKPHWGADLAYSGPVGLLVESGSLKVVSGGATVQLGEGDGIVLAGGVSHTEWNYQTEPTVALLVGFVPLAEEFIVETGRSTSSGEPISGVGAAPTAAPAMEQVDLAIVSVDATTGERLPGACYIIEGGSIEGCDENGDGQVDFDGVAPGAYVVTETRAPAGYRITTDLTIKVDADGGRYEVVHERDG